MTDMVPQLRRAGPSDADGVRDVTNAAYAKWVPILGRKPVPMLADYAQAVRTHRIDVLDASGRIVGLIELVPEPDALLIENIAILPDHVGRGHGSRLVAHAEDVARQLGLPRLRLYTNVKMATNIALYQSLGYAIDREELTDDGRTIVHMSRTVAATPSRPLPPHPQ